MGDEYEITRWSCVYDLDKGSVDDYFGKDYSRVYSACLAEMMFSTCWKIVPDHEVEDRAEYLLLSLDLQRVGIVCQPVVFAYGNKIFL